jgi:hypothetical protein
MLLFSLLLAACAAEDTCGGDTAPAIATSSATATGTGTGTGTGGGSGGPGAPPQNFFSLLTETGACGDLVFYAHNPDDTLALAVRLDGLASEARNSGTEIVRSWGLADVGTDVRVGVRQGMGVSSAVCNPTGGGAAGGESREWGVRGGTLEVAASADEAGTVHASMVLTDAIFGLQTATDTGTDTGTGTATNTSVITGGDIEIDAEIAG